MPRIIKFNDTRRGNLGGNRYRTFDEGEAYTVTETAGPPDTITEFLADQFVEAGVAEDVDVKDAPPVARTETKTQPPAPEDDIDDPARTPEPPAPEADDDGFDPKGQPAVSSLTTAQLEAVAKEEGVDLSEAKNNGERREAIERARK